MKNRWGLCRVVRAALSFLAFATPVAAQQIDACVNFAGSGIAAADQAAFLAKVQAYFNDAGIGVGDLQRVILQNNAAPPPGGCDISVTFINNAANNWHGNSDKRTHSCIVNQAHINAKFPGAANAARRCQAYAETMAHEIGHTLCAVHDCRGDGMKRIRGAMVGCSMAAPSLMTTGLCVTCPNRGIPLPGAGSRGFSFFSTLQMRGGIIRLALGLPNWTLSANFDVGVLGLVEGRSNTEPISFGGETLRAEDPLVTFDYQILQGDQNLFEFGWLNHTSQFIEPVPVSDNPDQLLEENGGAYLDFALRGRPGSGFDGQVFSQTDYGTVTLLGSSSPPQDAEVPPLTTTYFSQAEILFNVSGNLFRVRLSTDDWGDQNGFYLPLTAAVPSLSTAWLVVLGACALAGGALLLARRGP